MMGCLRSASRSAEKTMPPCKPENRCNAHCGMTLNANSSISRNSRTGVPARSPEARIPRGKGTPGYINSRTPAQILFGTKEPVLLLEQLLRILHPALHLFDYRQRARQSVLLGLPRKCFHDHFYGRDSVAVVVTQRHRYRYLA